MRIYSDLKSPSKELQPLEDFITGKIDFVELLNECSTSGEIKNNKKSDFKNYINKISI